jgi:hypothetical protein
MEATEKQIGRVREALDFEAKRVRKSMSKAVDGDSYLKTMTRLSYSHGNLAEIALEMDPAATKTNFAPFKDEDDFTKQLIRNVALQIVILETREIIL